MLDPETTDPATFAADQEAQKPRPRIQADLVMTPMGRATASSFLSASARSRHRFAEHVEDEPRRPRLPACASATGDPRPSSGRGTDGETAIRRGLPRCRAAT